MTYLQLGEKKKAKEEFKKVIQLDKGNLSQAAKQMLEVIE
jgi:Tfp pilus assembly protein PilF